jgi:hypothetical protein
MKQSEYGLLGHKKEKLKRNKLSETNTVIELTWKRDKAEDHSQTRIFLSHLLEARMNPCR